MSAVLQFDEIRIRPMEENDLMAVLEIEGEAYRYPWTPGIFRDCMRVGYSCWVCESQTQLVGYAILSIAVGECHLLNLCIDPAQQGKGFGRKLLRQMIEFARESTAQTMFLEVRPSNVHAVSLYIDEGFNEIGTRPNYYPSGIGREDAIIFAREL